MKLRKTIKKNFSPLLAALMVTLLLAVMILMVGLIGRSIKAVSYTHLTLPTT